MTSHLLTWHGIDDPTRADHASVEMGAGTMRAVGASHARDFSSSWELEVADGWVTRTLRVTTRGIGWERALVLSRSEAGEWSAEATSRGDSDLSAPGLADPASLDGALDCDLGLCPVTNTMPTRRLELLGRRVEATTLVMAWVEMPSLRVVRSEQVYSSGHSNDRVQYASADGSFAAELTIDSEGLVIDYPGLARRQRPRRA